MKNIKEKIHRTMEDKAIKKALDEELNTIGSYEIDENGKAICKIDKLKLIKMFKNEDEYRLNLPIPFLINLQASLNYKKCNKKIIDIEYIIEDCIFDKPFIIDSYSNVLFKGCYFSKGLIIKRGRNIKLTRDLIVSLGLSINAQQLDFCDSFVMYHSKTNNIGQLNVKTTNVDGLSLLSLDDRININSDVINMQSSNLRVGTLELNAKKINEKDNSITTTKKLIINDENNDEIKNVESDIVIYNGKDISNSDRIMIPKLRQQLIEDLKTIRRNVRIDIENDMKMHNEILETSSIKTFLKK